MKLKILEMQEGHLTLFVEEDRTKVEKRWVVWLVEGAEQVWKPEVFKTRREAVDRYNFLLSRIF